MADLPERDVALFLDMLLAARDAKAFIEGLDEAAFQAGCTRTQSFDRWKFSVRRRAESPLSREPAIPTSRGGISRACAIASSTATERCASTLSGRCFVTAWVR